MGKAIYWIDDNSSAIMNIVDSVFPSFWKLEEEDGIETHIRVFGNCKQETSGLALWSKKDEQKFQQDIIRKFERLCKNKDRLGERNLFVKKKDLICDNIVVMYKQPESKEKEQEIEEYKKIYSVWQGGQVIELVEGKKQISNEAQMLTKKLLERMNIAEGACIALDLALLQGDMEKVKLKKLPILSMELYHLIKEKHECFLYSYYFFEEKFIDAWKEVYSDIYCETSPIIHTRKELLRKNITETLTNELISMINKSYEERREGYDRKMEESN